MALRYQTTAWDSEMRSETTVTRTMIARFAGACARCDGRFDAGTEITYSRETRTARHYRCPVAQPRRS